MRLQSLADKLAETLAAELRERRTVRGVSMNELATRTGLSVSFIGYVERGMRRPSVETLAKIAWALDFSAAEILATVETLVLKKKNAEKNSA